MADPSHELDHPEILSKERLIDILRERCIHFEDLLNLEKSDLVELFYKHVTPKPQRPQQLRRARRKSTIIHSNRRKSVESLDVPNGKIARIVPEGVIKTNKNTPSVDSINTNTDTVAINCATSPIQSPRSHSNRNTITKSKVVKLNRKTLGLNLNNSQQETSSSIASSELISDDKMDIERDSRKRKFEKVAVTWP
ncbi:uncharacterized protein LOC141885303 [Acropora palmata]|uniref:uncharacterized protein LOC141885303 n=1 Tax=Acropora palmata TaxID=6131 RepID=UPI003DA01692